MLTCNLWTSKGLANGAQGAVKRSGLTNIGIQGPSMIKTDKEVLYKSTMVYKWMSRDRCETQITITKALIIAAIFQLWYLLNLMDTLDLKHLHVSVLLGSPLYQQLQGGRLKQEKLWHIPSFLLWLGLATINCIWCIYSVMWPKWFCLNVKKWENSNFNFRTWKARKISA